MQYKHLWTTLFTAVFLSPTAAAFAQEPGADSPEQVQDAEPQTADETSSSAKADAEPTSESSDTASAWKATFPPNASASYLPSGDDISVIVVAAGGHAEAELAADTLESALRDSGNFKLVMNDDVLAGNSKVDDEAIVAKTEHLPVGHVAIVRIFAGATGKAPSGVVTLYEKDSGEALTAMAVSRGTPVAANDRAPATSGAGVSKEAADAVAEAIEGSSRNVERAKQRYLENYVWFEDVAAVNQHGAVVGQWSNAYRGKFKEPLEGADFYEEVGRPDLTSDYRTWRNVKWGSYAVGAAASFGGLFYALSSIGSDSEDCWELDYGTNAYEQCEARNEAAQDERSRQMYVGYGIAGAGILLSTVALFINPQPVEPSEARRLAEKHNNKLRKKLGLSNASIDEQADPMNWSLDITGMKDGGGLRLRVDF